MTRDARRRLAQLGTAAPPPAYFESAEAFRDGVRAAYERRYLPDDRTRYPLAEVRLGPRFLASARALEGIDSERIIEAAAHVAAGRAHEIAGLQVHPLRLSEAGGAPQRERSDGAKGWRLSLQVETPAARRLHYWTLSLDGQRVVEFDEVGTHDELT